MTAALDYDLSIEGTLVTIGTLGYHVESMGQLLDSRWHVTLQRIDDDGIWTVPTQFAGDLHEALAQALASIPLAFHRSYATEALAERDAMSIDLSALGLLRAPPAPTFTLAKRFAR